MSQCRTGKRRKRRKKMVVPIRVRLAGSHQAPEPAHTLDATERGVRFSGFPGDVSVSDIVEIQYHRERALFRVVWVQAQENSAEKQVGAECVFDTNIWGDEFPQEADEYEEKE
jgi:hypothetical protein